MAKELFFHLRFQGAVSTLRKLPELVQSADFEMPFVLEQHGAGGTDALKELKEDQTHWLNGHCSEIYYGYDADDLKAQFKEFFEAQPELAQLELYLTADITWFGLEHREFGRVWPDEDWDSYAGCYYFPYQVSGIQDIHGAQHQVPLSELKGLSDDYRILMEDDSWGMSVSGGPVLLQLSSTGKWRCLSTQLTSEQVEDQESIEQYDYELWQFLSHDGSQDTELWVELCPAEVLLKVLQSFLPGYALSIQKKDGIPHFLDEVENEYFFGQMFWFDCEIYWEEKSDVTVW